MKSHEISQPNLTKSHEILLEISKDFVQIWPKYVQLIPAFHQPHATKRPQTTGTTYIVGHHKNPFLTVRQLAYATYLTMTKTSIV